MGANEQGMADDVSVSQIERIAGSSGCVLGKDGLCRIDCVIRLVVIGSRRAFLVVLVFVVMSLMGQASAQPGQGQGRGQGAGMGGSLGAGNDPEMLMQRRERMRNFRQDMQRRMDTPPSEGSMPRQAVGPGLRQQLGNFSGENPNDMRGLRRLNQEERQQLRRDLREAAREVYIQR